MSLDPANALRKVVKWTPGGYPYTTYVFRCPCGAEISSQHQYLKSHSGKCRRCAQKGPPFQTPYKALLANQKTRGISVHLTYEEFVGLCRIPECHYCGTPIRRTLKKGEPGYRGYFIDRKDNAAPYELSNCVPCCWRCNQAKGDRFTYAQFVEIANTCFRKPRVREPTFHELNGWDRWD